MSKLCYQKISLYNYIFLAIMFKLHKLLWIILICLSSSIEWLSDIDEMDVYIASLGYWAFPSPIIIVALLLKIKCLLLDCCYPCFHFLSSISIVLKFNTLNNAACFSSMIFCCWRHYDCENFGTLLVWLRLICNMVRVIVKAFLCPAFEEQRSNSFGWREPFIFLFCPLDAQSPCYS